MHSKNVFVLVLAHLEPELELFEVDDIGDDGDDDDLLMDADQNENTFRIQQAKSLQNS